MKPFVSMVRANLKMTVRNRMNLFWLLVFPAVFILLFGYLVGGNSNFSAGVGVVNGSATPISKQMVSVMKKSKIFELQNGAKKEELQKLKDGKITAVLVFPEKAVQGKPLRVQSYIDKSKQGTSQATAAAIGQIAEQFNQQAAGPTPRIIALNTRSVQSKNLRFIDFLVPGLLGMSIMNNGLIGLSSAFVVMRERGILRRVRVTPFPLMSFIAARVLTQLLIALLQATILLGMAKVAFNLSMVGSLLNVAAFVILGSLAFLTIGFFIAGVSRKVESANALANLVGFPMLFLAGVFFPLDQAPTWIQYVAKVLPLSYLADGLRQVMIYGASISHLWVDATALLATAVIGLLLATRFFRWEPKAT